jgi:hypothetical protein
MHIILAMNRVLLSYCRTFARSVEASPTLLPGMSEALGAGVDEPSSARKSELC